MDEIARNEATKEERIGIESKGYWSGYMDALSDIAKRMGKEKKK